MAYYLIEIQRDETWLPRRIVSVEVTFRTLLDGLEAFTDDFPPGEVTRVKAIDRAKRDKIMPEIERLWLDNT
jgi:hypothetical protein